MVVGIEKDLDSGYFFFVSNCSKLNCIVFYFGIFSTNLAFFPLLDKRFRKFDPC
jgi:hypothetical protein